MALREFKVESKTLEQIKDIIAKNSQGQTLVKQTIIDAIDKLWLANCGEVKEDSSTLLLSVDEQAFEIVGKPEFDKVLSELCGKKGPYKVTKKFKSWVGLSEGVYQIADCPMLIPVSWCDKFDSATPKFNYQALLIALLAILNIIQTIFIIAIAL